MGGGGMPMLQVVCNNCAYVALLAAVPMRSLADRLAVSGTSTRTSRH